jgi:alkanesulfonate monooxygenase SsuD/methylene tetrahydromethanopterin reductase-like flavin-dependent oxidoreductase (luciferase family)
MEIRGRQLHIGVQLQPQRASWAEYAQAVRRAEEVGAGSIWNADHLLPFAGPDDAPCFETLSTLAAMAVMTERVRIGVLVNGVLYRDPATLAKAAAQVDEMSGGRLEFSLGAAWAEREFAAYGLDFPPVGERLQRLDEALQIVKSLWTNERTTFEGRYYRIVDAPCAPKPVQQPLPPITVGGTGLGTVRVTARHATRLNVVGSPGLCIETYAKLERCCAQIGRDVNEIELSAHPSFAMAPSAEEAEERAEQFMAGLGRSLPADRSGWLIGTPEQVTGQLRRYLDAGVSHLVLAVGHPYDLEPLRVLRDEVVPALG